MSALIATQRYNWMGYNGTETDVANTTLLRLDANSKGSNADYEHRQEVMADIKDRLYLIKRDLNLIPEEEIRAEEEARRQRREARKQREAARREEEERRRAEEAERRRLEEEELERLRQEAEEEERRAEEEAARALEQRRRRMRDSDEDSDDEDERSALLARMPRTQAEIDSAVRVFSDATKMLLASRDQGYVSYLDGSTHSSIAVLEQYNANHVVATERALKGSSLTVPAAEDYATAELRSTLEARNTARKKLDARRVELDRTYAARLRKADRNRLPVLTEEDGDEAALLEQVEAAKASHEECRAAYNQRAMASGRSFAVIASAYVPEEESEPEVAPAPEASAPEEEVSPSQIARNAAPEEAEATAPSSKKSSPKSSPKNEEAAAEAPAKAASSKKSSKASSKKTSPKAAEDGEYPTEEPVKSASSKKTTPKERAPEPEEL